MIRDNPHATITLSFLAVDHRSENFAWRSLASRKFAREDSLGEVSFREVCASRISLRAVLLEKFRFEKCLLITLAVDTRQHTIYHTPPLADSRRPTRTTLASHTLLLAVDPRQPTRTPSQQSCSPYLAVDHRLEKSRFKRVAREVSLREVWFQQVSASPKAATAISFLAKPSVASLMSVKARLTNRFSDGNLPTSNRHPRGYNLFSCVQNTILKLWLS